MSYGGFCAYLLPILSHNAKSMAGAILEGHLRTQKNMFVRCLLGTVVLHLLGIRGTHTTPQICTLLVTFGSLRGTFGRLLVTKVAQRFQKVSQKRPNGSKAPQKGSKKTTRPAFLEQFDVFSTISPFSLVLASI